jgi:hypothetical protein
MSNANWLRHVAITTAAREVGVPVPDFRDLEGRDAAYPPAIIEAARRAGISTREFMVRAALNLANSQLERDEEIDHRINQPSVVTRKPTNRKP